MKIAIVDDEEIWIKKVRGCIEKFFEKTEVLVEEYSSGEEFLKGKREFQIVFMDIEMGGRDGFSILDEYRKRDEKALFIILTTHIELSRKGYQVEAFRYIDKNEISEMNEALSSAMLRLEKYQSIDIPIVNLGKQQIPCCNICYFEVYNHDVIMHLKDGETYKCIETLSELSERLVEKGFILLNRSYLANLVHIKRIDSDGVKLEDGVLPISRRRYSELKKHFFDWKMKRANG